MFLVCKVDSSESGIGETIRRFKSYPRAKAYAEDVAYDFAYGVVILDTVRDLVDWGDGWTRMDGAAPVDPPFYARRLAQLRP